ncbi:MAG: DUF4010 domain-containing protein [Candidatus Hydrothermarchaeaceae archaeon]
MTAEIEFIKMLVISSLVGGLIGIERELKEKVVVGMRTFMLTSMFGALSVWVATASEQSYFLTIAFLGIIFVAVLVTIIKNMHLWDIGVTTSVAFLVTFVLGVMVGLGMYFEGVAGGLIVTGVLVSKAYSTAFSKTLTHEEIRNALEFGIIAFILFPIVPDAPIDPYGLINPRTLILIIILVASIGFVGFIAIRKVGMEKGLPIVGALGGLINSEAAAGAISNKVKEAEGLLSTFKVAIVLTNSVMLVRNLIIAGFVSLAVFRIMVVPQILMAAAGLVYARFIKFEKETEKVETPIESPFAIMPSIRFAVFFTFISFLVTYLKGFGVESVYLAAFLGGVVTSAGVTASFASLASTGSLDPAVAAYGCVIAAMGSSIGKILITRISGTAALAKEVINPQIIVVLVGLFALLGMWAL